MKRQGVRLIAAALIASTAMLPQAGWADPSEKPAASMEEGFQDPPNTARPRVWWHWMNGNITKDGIAKDIDWMARMGIGGLQNFDINLDTPIRVKNRLVYMTPEWKDAFRFAAAEADKRGLELAIASSPGWSETGGPWVTPEQAMKKIVWSETELSGGKRFNGKLAPLPDATGPYQHLEIFDLLASLMGAKHPTPPKLTGDIAVYAVPLTAPTLPQPTAVDGAGTTISAAAFSDTDLNTASEFPRGTADAPTQVVLDYGKPITARSLSFFAPGARGMFIGAGLEPVVEASTDGKSWTNVAKIPIYETPATLSFAPVTARWFKLTLRSLPAEGSNLDSAAPGLADSPIMQLGKVLGASPIKIGDFRLSAEARIDRAEAKAAFAIERDYTTLPSSDENAVSVPLDQIIDLTSKLKPDGTLDWTPPKGKWRIVRMGYSLVGKTNHPATAEATGLEVDKLDSGAVRAYLEHYIGMYRDAAGKDLIGKRGVRALLTDSIEVGPANWTPKLVEQFKRLRGYDPTPWLPALTGVLVKSRGDSDRFLYDYRRTLSELAASEHYGTVAAVARENNLTVYGEALESGRPSLGDDMALRKYTDVPMAALWTNRKEGKPNPTYVADMKGAASVAHVYGQNIVAAESMTSALNYWADSPRTLKKTIDLEFVTGINRPVVHTSVHSPDEAGKPGLSLMIFGQFFNRHDSWAELARPWVDYMSRNSFLLQQGRNHADVAYFYGEEAPLTGLYGEKPVTDAPKRYAYDFVNADAVVEALRVEGNEVVSSGGARYRVLYLGGSSDQMTLPMLRRLTQLVESGATVVGRAPTSTPSLADDKSQWGQLVARLWPGTPRTQVGKGQVIASNDIEAALSSLDLAPDFETTGGSADLSVPFIHRRLIDGDSYFLVNEGAREESFEGRFRVSGKEPQLWNAETGTVERTSYRIENGVTIVPLTLAAEKSVHVVFRKPTDTASLALPKPQEEALLTLADNWTVSFEADRGAPTSIEMRKLTPLNEIADPRVKYFSGIATYRNVFTAPKTLRSGERLWLDLGDMREVAEVRINGKAAGTSWHAPYRIDVSSFVKPGRNDIEIRVANLWINRLIGDAQPGAEKITWTSMPTYAADAQLRPSGLIGPVVLRKELAAAKGR